MISTQEQDQGVSDHEVVGTALQILDKAAGSKYCWNDNFASNMSCDFILSVTASGDKS